MTATDVRKRHRFLLKHGYRPMYFWERMRCSHYNKGGYKWRINSRGGIDRSCPHDEFDRWANSTEQTWTFEEFVNDHTT